MKKPKIEYYWATFYDKEFVDGMWKHTGVSHKVNWRLVGANGEIMCQSTQGFRDKADAQRSTYAIQDLFTERPYPMILKEVGPGRKPK